MIPGIVGWRRSGASYTGPLDLVPGALFAYSQRAMTGGSTADSIRLREAGGDTEQTFALVSNEVSVSAVNTFLNGQDGFGVTYFDQSGNNHHVTNATGTKQPQWLSSAVNSKPGFQFDGVNDCLTTSGNVPILGGAYTVFIVTKKADPADTGSYIIGTPFSASYFQFSLFSGVGAVGELVIDAYDDDTGNECGGVFSPVGTGTDYHVLEAAITFGSRSAMMDGESLTEISDRDNVGAPQTINLPVTLAAFDDADSDKYGGVIVEVILYPSVLSAGDRLAIRQNISTYY